MSEYYYLLSSLPELSADEQKKNADIKSVSSHILEQLSDKDRRLFRYLLYQNDNKNIVQVYANSLDYYCPYKDYFSPSVFESSMFEHPKTVSSTFPAYMRKFREYSKGVEYSNIRHIENTLLAMYYDEAAGLKNSFVSDYFSFARDLRNIITAISMRLLGVSSDLIKQEFVGTYELLEILSKSSAHDFGISKEYPYITHLIEAFESKDPLAVENAEMRIVFEYLEQKTSSMFFKFENVFAYYIKCSYIERLMSKDAEKGKEVVKMLVAELKKDIESLN